MFDFPEFHIPTGYPVQSLAWFGDFLMDWPGATRYLLDGTRECGMNKRDNLYSYGYCFDAAITSPSSEYTAVYTRHHTKALILRHGRLHRELNRSYYHADVHEYPIALLRLKSGQEVVAHCPDNYCQLEIDDLETGRRLTSQDRRDPKDYFFSRLMVDPQGEFIASAGWWWHPFDFVNVYHVESGLQDPAVFDHRYENIDATAEDINAAFTENGHLLAILSEIWGGGDEELAERLRKEPAPFGVFLLFDPRTRQVIHRCLPEARVGTIMPVGEHHVVGFYEHPRLFDLRTGAVVHSWPHLDSGTQTGCISGAHTVPPMALDMQNRRFAIASKSEVVAVQIDLRSTPGME